MKKIRVNPCSSVVDLSLCLSAGACPVGCVVCYPIGVAEIQSIKTTKLCETKPISQKPKMNLTIYMTRDYDNKSASLTPEKQTQFKPNQTQWIHYCSAFRKSLYTSQIRSFLVIPLIDGFQFDTITLFDMGYSIARRVW
jgi:hypothetical protein